MKLEPDHSKVQGSCSTFCPEDLLCGAPEPRASVFCLETNEVGKDPLCLYLQAYD